MGRYKEPPVKVDDETMLFKVIRASFNERRKTLQNGLSHYSEFDFTKEEIKEAIERCGLPPAVRGEKLALSEFACLANALTALREKP